MSARVAEVAPAMLINHLPFKPIVESPMQSYFGGLDMAAQGLDPLLKGVARCQLEMLGLWSRRAQAYLEIPSRLAQCRTPQDVVNEQTRFWQIAFQHYSEGTHRMMAAAAQMATPPQITPPKRRHARDYLSMGADAKPEADASGEPAYPRRVA